MNTKDEITSNLHVNDVEAEQKKYNNFWEGIQRRVALQQAHSKANDFMAVIKSATKKTKVFLSLYKYYKIERIKFSHYTTALCRYIVRTAAATQEEVHHPPSQRSQSHLGPVHLCAGDILRCGDSSAHWLQQGSLPRLPDPGPPDRLPVLLRHVPHLQHRLPGHAPGGIRLLPRHDRPQLPEVLVLGGPGVHGAHRRPAAALASLLCWQLRRRSGRSHPSLRAFSQTTESNQAVGLLGGAPGHRAIAD